MSDASEPTVADHARLEQELARLRTERSTLRASLGGEDPDDPDVGDSGDQSQALEGDDDLARIGQRIREIEHLITSPEPQAGLADGTIVTLRFDGGDVATFRVVAVVEEAGTDEVITSDSPLGRALVGRSAGDTLTYEGPDGDLQAELVELRPSG